jgi:hypothetical protein
VQAAVLGQPYPEGIASLHLASRAPVLTITTIDATTDFDTVIFVLPSCGDAAITPLACNDDAFGGTTASSIHLTDVAAGDYVVVVEAATSQGGHYRLSALSR